MSEIELVVLGLINEKPKHGYEIEELIEERGIREWTSIAFSSIYYVLKRLDKAGWVHWELATANRGLAKKVYSISDTGKLLLKQNIIEILSTPKYGRSILLGLANLPVLEIEEAILALNKYQYKLHKKLTLLETKLAEPSPFFVKEMFNYSITGIKAELAWLEDFLSSIKSQ